MRVNKWCRGASGGGQGDRRHCKVVHRETPEARSVVAHWRPLACAASCGAFSAGGLVMLANKPMTAQCIRTCGAPSWLLPSIQSMLLRDCGLSSGRDAGPLLPSSGAGANPSRRRCWDCRFWGCHWREPRALPHARYPEPLIESCCLQLLHATAPRSSLRHVSTLVVLCRSGLASAGCTR